MEADLIARIAIEQFNKLPKKGKHNPSSEWTTMAAIIQNDVNDADVKESKANYKVISLGTGTKCLGRNELGKMGDVVSDSHAEILARRSFLLYLYEQLELCKSGKENKSIFEFRNQEKLIKNMKLRTGITFHMFVSHLPCGDAAIVDNASVDNSNTVETEVSSPPAKKSKIELSTNESKVEHRTGAKLQVGPLQYEETQITGKCRVKPGKGDPTLGMSCSDKIAKWQVLGLQGGLLNVFIPEPITLKSITIGGNVPFSTNSCERALYTRIAEYVKSTLANTYPEFIEGYQCPIIQKSDFNFMEFKDNSNPTSASISWFSSVKSLDPSNENVQVVVGGRKQGATKKFFGKPSSMVEICRAKLFLRFKNLYFSQHPETDSTCNDYKSAKSLSDNYVKAWELLKEQVFSGWTDKPAELKTFT